MGIDGTFCRERLQFVPRIFKEKSWTARIKQKLSIAD